MAPGFDGALLRLISRRDDERILTARLDVLRADNCRGCLVLADLFLSSSNHAFAIFMSP
jgi:hypothetical protein